MQVRLIPGSLRGLFYGRGSSSSRYFTTLPSLSATRNHAHTSTKDSRTSIKAPKPEIPSEEEYVPCDPLTLQLYRLKAIRPISTMDSGSFNGYTGVGPNDLSLGGDSRLRQRKPKRERSAIRSPENGDIPEPEEDYLAITLQPPLLLPQPRKILVVLDLNGTLLYRPNRSEPFLFIERPYAREFLSYCINTFCVVIWSSARPHNVQKMCAQLIKPEDRSKVIAIWARDTFGLSAADYNRRAQCYKRLMRLWSDPQIASHHPLETLGKNWGPLDTVLVDDSAEKGRQEPYNLVQVPEFEGDAQEAGYVLPQIHDYLNECSQQANVCAYIRSKPFKFVPNFVLSPQNAV